MTTLTDFPARKAEHSKLTLLTCYDAYTAAILARTGIDAVLVGDSAAMVVHGQASTLTADIEMIAAHVRAVRAGAPSLPIIADMPFLSTRRGLEQAVSAAGRLMQAGADGVKIEGLIGHEALIPHLVHSGIPVMGHLGLTPQSIHTLGGYKVQGKSETAANSMREQAREMQRLGCFGIVLECIPSYLGTEISQDLDIPVIGIGAGDRTDGQILVLQDMLGMGSGRVPRFVRQYLNGSALIQSAVEHYIDDVHSGEFPAPAEQYRFAPPQASPDSQADSDQQATTGRDT